MAPQAQRKRPQFFKVLFPDPFTNQTIPRQFQKHLPCKLRKTATLVSPQGKFWHVKISRIGEDIHFQKGWLEFAKAHGLGKGYLVIFRYEGNMIFNVKIFDAACCLKDYSLTNCTLPMWASSPESSLVPAPVCPADRALTPPPRAPVASVNACAGTRAPVLASRAPVPSYVRARTPCPACTPVLAPASTRASALAPAPVPLHAHSLVSSPASSQTPALSLSLASIPGPTPRPCYIEIEESCDATDQALEVKCEESDMEILCDSFVKTRKLSNGKWQVVKIKRHPTLQKEVQGKRSVKIKQEILDVDDEPEGETQILVDALNRKRKFSNGKSQSINRKGKKPISRRKVQKKKNRGISPHLSSHLQFEKILTTAAVKYNLVSIPKSFCLKNGLVTSRTIFLKRKLEGEDKILLKEWPVQLILRPSEAQLRNGWKDFTKENGLKKGDKCNFKLVSNDTVLVSMMPQRKLPIGVKGEIVEKREVSSIATSKKKKQRRAHSKSFARSEKIVDPKRNWRNGKNRAADETKTWTYVRKYHLTYKYMTLSRGFCIENMLTSRREMILKNPEGKEWHISYSLNGLKEGRFYGLEWKNFSKENGLKEGDRCDFKLVEEDTMLVHVVKECACDALLV